MADPKDVVGHMCGEDGCKPLTRDVAEGLFAAAKRSKAERAERMPDEQSAIRAMFDAYTRLKELGWHEATYAKKGVPLQLLEVGSTGIHEGYRDEFGFWINSHNDTWPSRPVLSRSPDEAAVKTPATKEPHVL